MAVAGEEDASGQAYGLAVTFIGGLMLTFDVPLLKLTGADSWTLIFVRGIMTFCAFFTFWLVFRYRSGRGDPFVNGYTSVLVAILMAAANIFFINAIQHTSVANVVFILAFNPMFAAIMAWLWLGERISLVTGLAIASALSGVGIIVWDGLVVGTWAGDLMALAVSMLLAIAITAVRRSGTDQSMSPAFGALLAAGSVALFASPASLDATAWSWLALNALIVMPLSSGLLMIGPRYIPAALVAMFYLLETVLTPVWMWLIFDEVPSNAAVIGGSIVIATLFAHSLWTLMRRRPRIGPARRPVIRRT